VDQLGSGYTRGLGTRILWFFLVVAVAACGDSGPIKVGFIGGTSGRVADLGVAGRDGVILAVEERNAGGGIHGRKVELLFRDDQQNPQMALAHAQDLIDRKVAAIVGPMTSAMAVAIVPIANRNKTLVISPTTTTNQLAGKDDYFLRTIVPTRYHAAKSADFQLRRGLRRFALGYDTNNLAYTTSWKQDFQDAVEKAGGEVVLNLPFVSSENTPFPDLSRELVTSHPDGIVLICNSVDAAIFAQQIRKLDTRVALIFSEWAGTERLIELGGHWVEGAHVPQYLNRHSVQKKYIDFVDRYVQRFKRRPGYPGMLAYNAASIVLTALDKQRSDEDLKATILRIKTFPGVQQSLSFDRYGDTLIRTYITEIKDGEFVVVE